MLLLKVCSYRQKRYKRLKETPLCNISHCFTAHQYQLTASLFGQVLRRHLDTPPDSLVLQITELKHFTSAATEWDKIK